MSIRVSAVQKCQFLMIVQDVSKLAQCPKGKIMAEHGAPEVFAPCCPR